MNRQKYQRVCGGAIALMCVVLPGNVSGQQTTDPFIENMRERNDVTSRALEQSPLGGLFRVLRGDHLEGSGQNGAAPLFRRGQTTQARPPQQTTQQAGAGEKTRLSLRNPLEGKVTWRQPAQQTPPKSQAQVQSTPGRAAQQQARQQQQVVQAPREGNLTRFFAGLKEKRENRSPNVRDENGGRLFAFLRKGDSDAQIPEEDWSQEAQRRTNARAQTPKEEKPKVQLASLNNPTSVGALSRLVKKTNFNSWMGVPKDDEQASAVQPKPEKKKKVASSTSSMTTWEQHYVKSDRTAFHAAGTRLNAKRPDRLLGKGTTVHVTNRGWNWSNVVLSDGRRGSVATSRLSRSRVDASPPRSASKRSRAVAQNQGTTASKSGRKSTSKRGTPGKKETASVDRSDDPLIELEKLNASSGSNPSELELTRAELDAVLEPSLESLLDPGVEATLRDLEDELLLPLPPVFPEDVDTGAGMLPPLD